MFYPPFILVDELFLKVEGNTAALLTLQRNDSRPAAPQNTYSSAAIASSDPADVILSQELIARNYAKVTESMAQGNIRGAALSQIEDRHKNIPEVGLLNVKAGPKSGPASVSLELSGIRRDTITMMNELPPDINIQVADEIRTLIAKGEWPTDTKAINDKIIQISQSFSQV